MSDKKIGTGVSIPKITYPFRSSTNPRAAEAQERHMRWADRHGVFVDQKQRATFAAMNIGDLAGRLHPEADLEDLCLLTDWVAWLFLRDDRWDVTDDFGEWERLAERDRAYLRLMRHHPALPENTPGSDEDGLASALVNLCARLRRRARENSLPDPIDGDFLSLMRSFFFSNIREAFHQRRHESPPLRDYIEMRRATGGLEILTKVQSVIDGVRLPAKFFARPAVRYLTEVSHNICCWHNDLLSLEKELLIDEVNNLVVVLLQDPANDCSSLQQAVDLAARMVQEEVKVFAGLEHEVLETLGEQYADAAKWYTQMLRNRASGILAWEEDCAVRYRELLAIPL